MAKSQEELDREKREIERYKKINRSAVIFLFWGVVGLSVVSFLVYGIGAALAIWVAAFLGVLLTIAGWQMQHGRPWETPDNED